MGHSVSQQLENVSTGRPAHTFEPAAAQAMLVRLVKIADCYATDFAFILTPYPGASQYCRDLIRYDQDRCHFKLK